ncbi:MAG: ATP-binding cassette domain-containing protein, partial [Phycisphaerales bacterium]|nr:ATP-binding cassette domain-containing protein [Phycisphaerales bacterium]
MTKAAIEISGVHKRFGRTHAVRDLDLIVPEGSLCGFLGPNGAGKSTTIRMIMSIIYPDEGSINVLGSSALANKNRIGYLPEERGVYRKMKVGAFLEYIGKLKGVERRVLRPRVTEWLKKIELPGVQNKKCEELSKGMQQKVQF